MKANPQEQGKSKRRKERPLEQKESVKWLRSFRKVSEIQALCPETVLVSIGDREADIYELFLEASRTASAAKLLVRAEKTRNRHVEQEHLWEFMARQPIAGALKIHIPKAGNQRARDAFVEMR